MNVPQLTAAGPQLLHRETSGTQLERWDSASPRTSSEAHYWHARVQRRLTFQIFPAAFIGGRTQPVSQPRTSITPRTRSRRLRPPARATHQPDVAVKIRPQLARCVPLGVHPPSAGGAYIPAAPARDQQTNGPRTRFAGGVPRRLPRPPPAQPPTSLLRCSGCWVQIAAGLTAHRPTQRRDVSMQRSIALRSSGSIRLLRLHERRARAAPHSSSRGRTLLPRGGNAACSRVRVRDTPLPRCRLKSSACVKPKWPNLWRNVVGHVV